MSLGKLSAKIQIRQEFNYIENCCVSKHLEHPHIGCTFEQTYNIKLTK